MQLQAYGKSAMFMITLLVWGSCADNNTATDDTLPKELIEAESLIANSLEVLAKLQARHDSIVHVDELDAIRIWNNMRVLEENLDDLKARITEYKTSGPATSKNPDLLKDLKVQHEYVETLVASGEAILRGNSLSFGAWSEEPVPSDSVTTPVGGAGR